MKSHTLNYTLRFGVVTRLVLLIVMSFGLLVACKSQESDGGSEGSSEKSAEGAGSEGAGESEGSVGSGGGNTFTKEKGSYALKAREIRVVPAYETLFEGIDVYSVRFSPNGKTFAAELQTISESDFSLDGYDVLGFGVFDTASMEMKQTVRLPDGVKGNPDYHALGGNTLAFAVDERLFVYSLDDPDSPEKHTFEDDVHYVSVSGDGNWAAVSLRGEAFMLDVARGSLSSLTACGSLQYPVATRHGVLCEADRTIFLFGPGKDGAGSEQLLRLNGYLLGRTSDESAILINEKREYDFGYRPRLVSLPGGEVSDAVELLSEELEPRQFPDELKRAIGNGDDWLLEHGEMNALHWTLLRDGELRPLAGRKLTTFAFPDSGPVGYHGFGLQKYNRNGENQTGAHVHPGGRVRFLSDDEVVTWPMEGGSRLGQHWSLESGQLKKLTVLSPDFVNENGMLIDVRREARLVLPTAPDSEHGVVEAILGQPAEFLLVREDDVWKVVKREGDEVLGEVEAPPYMGGEIYGSSDDGSTLVVVGEEKVRVYQTEPFKEVATWEQEGEQQISPLLSNDGKLLRLQLGHDLTVYDTMTGQTLLDEDAQPDTLYSGRQVGWIKPSVVFINSELLLLAMEDEDEVAVLKRDGDGFEQVGRFDFEGRHPQSATMSPDGSRIAVSFDGSLIIWDTAALTE